MFSQLDELMIHLDLVFPLSHAISHISRNVLTLQMLEILVRKIAIKFLKVNPPPESTLDMGKILSLVSGDNNILQQYFESNNSPKAFSLCSTVGLILNHIAQNKTTKNDTEISSAQVCIFQTNCPSLQGYLFLRENCPILVGKKS